MRLRTREIKPGVYETQSAGRHVAGQVGIAFGILIGVVVFFSLANPVENFPVILVLVLVGGPIAYWHYSYRKAHRDEYRERPPGPWD